MSYNHYVNIIVGARFLKKDFPTLNPYHDYFDEDKWLPLYEGHPDQEFTLSDHGESKENYLYLGKQILISESESFSINLEKQIIKAYNNDIHDKIKDMLGTSKNFEMGIWIFNRIL